MSEKFRALMIEKEEDTQTVKMVDIEDNDLMEGNVLVNVTHSTLNYKDGLAITGASPVVRSFPMIPGIDFSGIVLSSEDNKFSEGDRVVLNGYGLSESHFGGYSEKARVKSEHLLKLPENISNKQAMAIGTAGYTAMLCVLGIEDHGINPDDGVILVSGASGGVGSVVNSTPFLFNNGSFLVLNVSFLIFKSITNHFSSNPKSFTLFDILLLINDFVPSQPIIHFPLYLTFLLEHVILVVRVVLFLNSFILIKVSPNLTETLLKRFNPNLRIFSRSG